MSLTYIFCYNIVEKMYDNYQENKKLFNISYYNCYNTIVYVCVNQSFANYINNY